MKTNRKITRTIFAALMAASITFYISSCKKDSSSSSSTTSPTFSETDASNLTTDALIPATGGMATSVSNTAGIYQTAALKCGVQKDSSIVKSSATGATPSYDYNLSWTYTLDCNGVVPTQLTLNSTGTLDYDGTLISSSDKSTGAYVLTGFGAAVSQYNLTVNYSRSGTTVSKILNKNTFTTSLQITSSNLAVDKTTQEIASGTAQVTITATSTSGKTFSFSGTLTFLGSKKATLVLNSGTSYNISWS